MAEVNELIDYIRKAAIKRGINPDVAVRVAQHEGGLKNPFRKGEGPAPRSQAKQFGRTENSYGPFQLYISGTGAGLGDRAVKAGIDPRKNWRGGIDFALDEVVRKGWGQWYGAKAAGVTGFHGVGKGARPAGFYAQAEEGDGVADTPSALPKGTVTEDGASTWDEKDAEDKPKSKWATLGENLAGLGEGMGSDEYAVAPTPNMETPDTDYAQASAIPTDYYQQYLQTAAQGGVIQHLDDGGPVADPDEDDGTAFNKVLKMMGLIA